MVTALFTRRNTPYRLIPGVECYDINRNALTYDGQDPVICHPPCRSWGRFKHRAKPEPGEKDLAFFAVAAVQRCGGILEHPEGSTLWAAAHLPPPGGLPDKFGGRTIVIDQSSFGHRARKRTWLYHVGGTPPPQPPARQATTTVERMCRAERERTPLELAIWLVQFASSAPAPTHVGAGAHG